MISSQQIEQQDDESKSEQKSLENNLDMDQCLEFVNPKGKYQTILFLILLAQGIFGSFVFAGGPYYFEDPIFIYQDGLKMQARRCMQLRIFFNFSRNFLSDLKGRRLPMILSWMFGVIGSAILAFSQNVAMVLAGQFLSGFGTYPSLTIACIIMSEQSIGKFRKVTTGFLMPGYLLSQGVITLIGYIFDNNWVILTRYWLLISMILLQFTNLYIIEILRFYLNKDKQKLVDCLNAISIRNQKNKNIQKLTLSQEQIDFSNYSLINKNQVYRYAKKD